MASYAASMGVNTILSAVSQQRSARAQAANDRANRQYEINRATQQANQQEKQARHDYTTEKNRLDREARAKQASARARMGASGQNASSGSAANLLASQAGLYGQELDTLYQSYLLRRPRPSLLRPQPVRANRSGSGFLDLALKAANKL